MVSVSRNTDWNVRADGICRLRVLGIQAIPNVHGDDWRRHVWSFHELHL